MSASIVRQALELSSQEEGVIGVGGASTVAAKLRNKNRKKEKLLLKKKKQQLSGEKLLKQNLKILKALDSLSASRSKQVPKSESKPFATPDVSPPTSECLPKKSRKSSKKRRNQSQTADSVFTDEDFAKFESEYFVTD